MDEIVQGNGFVQNAGKKKDKTKKKCLKHFSSLTSYNQILQNDQHT